MRDAKSSLLLLVSLILFLMSFIILCTWGYNTYYRSKEKKERTVAALDDTANISRATRVIANATRDSLQKIYTSALRQMDAKLDSAWRYADSLKGPLGSKLNEFLKLRSDIASVINDKNNIADLSAARQKIFDLQKRVDELVGRNRDVEQENKRLYAMLKQLSANTKDAETVRPVVFENKQPAESVSTATKPPVNTTPAVAFMASELSLSAIMQTDNNKEVETFQALQADKLIGSFVVKSDNNPYSNAEVVVVVLQPDGQVLQKSSWESGTFNTNEGKKIYSCKMRFDYNKGEVKKLVFTLASEKFLKGNYIMQVYFNGTLIGRLSKTLS